MSKKIKITIITTATILVGIIVVLIYINYTNNNYLKRFRELLVNNNYATDEDLANCKNTFECLNTSIKYLDSGTTIIMAAISQSSSEYNLFSNKISDIKTYAAEKNYKELYSVSNELINGINNKKDIYIKTYSNDFIKLRDKLESYGPINYYIINNWAVVSIYKPENDSANIILRKAGTWEMAAGPYTDYIWGQDKELENTLSNKIDLIIDTPVLNYFKEVNYKPRNNSISNQIKIAASEIKAIDELPYSGDDFDIRLEFVNELPNYIVTIYNSKDGVNIKKTAETWLKERDITTKNDLIYFNIESQADYLE